MASHFADRLYDAVQQKRTPLIVGIDPVYNRLPAEITSQKSMNDESDAAAALDAVLDFSREVMRLVAAQVPAVKLNIAFFERYLWEGVEAYYSLVSEAEDLGLEIIGDVKRGDIGHTAEQYAAAHLENPELVGLEDTLAPDAITVNGFAGLDGIEPFAKMADQQGKGIFVWVLASNPSAQALQYFEDAQGRKWFEKLAEQVNSEAVKDEHMGSRGYSNIGMVAAANDPAAADKLRKEYDKIWFLVPGYGSQGASAENCLRYCKNDGTGALINASRSIIYAYEKQKYRQMFDNDWRKCIQQAVTDAKVELAETMQTKI